MPISEELQRRIASFTGDMVGPTQGAISNQEMDMFRKSRMNMGVAPKGAISNEEMQLLQQAGPASPIEDIAETINALTQQLQSSNDPEERDILENMIENTIVKANAPLAPLMDQLSMSAGEDDMMAHVRKGDLNISREMVDPPLEDAIEKSAREKGIPPESLVIGGGGGVTSLHEITGLEQHGFLKKLVKGVGKVIKKVAPLAMFIPGVGTALGGIMGGIGGLATSGLTSIGLGGVASTLGGAGTSLMGGLAGLGIPGVSSIAGGAAGGFGGIPAALTTKAGLLGGGMFGQTGSKYIGGPAAGKGFANITGMGSGTQAQVNAYNLAQTAQQTLNNMTPAIMKTMTPAKLQQLQQIAAGGSGTGIGSLVGGLTGGGSGQGGGMGDLAKLGIAGGVAGALGKLAYEEAKKDKGVQMTPLTSMDATGRYNIEAEIARRMGQQAPNPVEFGLLPAGTFPTLSGGQPLTNLPVPLNARYGGGIMAYANGGDVSMAEFEKMNGGINGEGTEISDEIPAMLSDGEFVMTGQAVRGAGKYEMATGDGGIMTLIPSLDENRERGTNLMYRMMEAFSGQAVPA